MQISDENNAIGRVRAAVADLVARQPSFRGREVAEATGLPIAHVRVYLQRLVGEGSVSRLGRDLFRGGRGRQLAARPGIPLRPAAQAVADALVDGGAPAVISGLDVLVPWANQIAGDGGDVLVIADRGAGEVVEDALASHSDLVVVEPSDDQLRLLARRHDEPAVVVRERALDDRTVQDGRRRPEDAWLDLVAEARRGWPVGSGELAAILRNLSVDGPSWTHLRRAARRRNMPVMVDASASMPLRIQSGDGFWGELASELDNPA